MEAATRRRGDSLRAILAPFARHPWATFFGGGSILFLLVSWACWATQLWGLPDIGDPFDVAAFEAVRVPDERNAFLDYQHASALVKGPDRAFRRALPMGEGLEEPRSWAKAGPAWRTFLADAGEALATYRAGSEKPDAQYHHPEGLSLSTRLPVTQDLNMLSRVAVLEGLRLEAEGDMVGAWGWYRAVLRASRHCGRHGFQIERAAGTAIHKRAAGAIARWAGDPRVDAPLLRRALDEVIAADAMTVPRSDSIKKEYLLFLHELDNPGAVIDGFFMDNRPPLGPDDWVQALPIYPTPKRLIHHGRFVVQDEKERAIRVSRLMVANWLAEVDKPASRRARLATRTPPIYEAGPDTPPDAKILPPEDLAAWYESSFLTRQFFGLPHQSSKFVERERIAQAKLVLTLAEQIYLREHDGIAPPSPQALVGTVLTALPEGYDAPDPPDGRR